MWECLKFKENTASVSLYTKASIPFMVHTCIARTAQRVKTVLVYKTDTKEFMVKKHLK
jgi:hypothetical protein